MVVPDGVRSRVPARLVWPRTASGLHAPSAVTAHAPPSGFADVTLAAADCQVGPGDSFTVTIDVDGGEVEELGVPASRKQAPRPQMTPGATVIERRAGRGAPVGLGRRSAIPAQCTRGCERPSRSSARRISGRPTARSHPAHCRERRDPRKTRTPPATTRALTRARGYRVSRVAVGGCGAGRGTATTSRSLRAAQKINVTVRGMSEVRPPLSCPLPRRAAPRAACVCVVPRRAARLRPTERSRACRSSRPCWRRS